MNFGRGEKFFAPYVGIELLRQLRRGILSFCLLMLLCTPLFASTIEGKTVTGIELKMEGQLPDRNLLRLVSIRPGDPFTHRSVRKVMKTLFDEGLGRDVVVDAVEEKGGVRLTFTIIPKELVSAVSVQGNRLISEKKVKKIILLKAGDEFTEWKVRRSVDALEERYRQEGFLGVVAGVGARKTDAGREVTVTVDEGERSTVSIVEFSGDTIFPVEELKSLVSLKAGGPFRQKLVDKTLEKLRQTYRDRGYVRATVGTPVIHAEPGGMSVVVEFPIRAGDRLEVAFSGNRHYSDKALKKQLPFVESRDLSEGGVDEAKEALLRFYRENGWYFAVVRAEFSRGPGVFSVKFDLEEGEKVHLDQIVMEGNRAFTRDEILSVMELHEKGWFTGGVFTDQSLERDVSSIIGLYADRGYLGASITRRQVDIEGDKVRLTLGVDEGGQTQVVGIIIKGSGKIEAPEITKALESKAGKFYSEKQVREDRYRILSLYANQGYIYADVAIDQRFSDDRRSVDLTYTITEDKPVSVGRITITGLEQTKPKVVKREITVREGEVFSYEKILHDQSKVYKTGLFSSVTFEPMDTPIDGGGKTYVKDLAMKVKEKNAGAVEVGIGYGDEERFRGTFDISYNNLWGLNRYLGFRGEMSAIESKYLATFKEPRLFNKLYDFRATAVKQQLERKQYDLDVLGLTAGIEKEFSPTVKGSLLYQLETADVSNVKPGAILREEDSGRIETGSIVPSITWDTRDNPLDPTKGFLNGLTFKFATEALGSEINFYKLTGQSSWYYTPWKKITTVLSGRFGISETLSGDAQLPISERFFIGGRTTVRGYALDTLGPKGFDGAPTGGNAMVIINAEVRFPLHDNFAGALFVDSGNVWQSLSDMDITDLKKTTGLGILYRTPVGPLRLDYAVKLDRKSGESDSEWHFTLGYSF